MSGYTLLYAALCCPVVGWLMLQGASGSSEQWAFGGFLRWEWGWGSLVLWLLKVWCTKGRLILTSLQYLSISLIYLCVYIYINIYILIYLYICIWYIYIFRFISSLRPWIPIYVSISSFEAKPLRLLINSGRLAMSSAWVLGWCPSGKPPLLDLFSTCGCDMIWIDLIWDALAWKARRYGRKLHNSSLRMHSQSRARPL